MDELGGLLSNCPQLILAKGFVCVGAWLVGLAGLVQIVNNGKYHLLITASATLLTVGGATLDYLRWEANSASAAPEPFHPISLLPKLCAVATVDSVTLWEWALFPSAVFFIVWIFRIVPTPTSTSLHRAG